jgi:hypothetical protein
MAPQHRLVAVRGLAVLEVEMARPVDQERAVGVVQVTAWRPDVEPREKMIGRHGGTYASTIRQREEPAVMPSMK